MKTTNKKILIFFGMIILAAILIVFISTLECLSRPGITVLSIVLDRVIHISYLLWQDIHDIEEWLVSQRKLERGGLINNKTDIRISFAYLYRIKIDNKYLLIKNRHNTGKFQPVGGAYRMSDDERKYLVKKYHVVDDDKVALDQSSRNDYRLYIKNKYLRDFVKRFDDEADRERVSCLSREFKEEMIDSGILKWKNIKYRVCGRNITGIRFSEHFQVYELLLADIVEVLLTEEQISDIKKMMTKTTNYLRFCTSKEIKHLGVDVDSGNLTETIGDHTKFILQDYEEELTVLPEKEEYSVNLD